VRGEQPKFGLRVERLDELIPRRDDRRVSDEPLALVSVHDHLVPKADLASQYTRPVIRGLCDCLLQLAVLARQEGTITWTSA
jgi:hypothetical protein